jgi:hypothetical protein
MANSEKEELVTCPRCRALLDSGIALRGCSLCDGDHKVVSTLAFLYRIEAMERFLNYEDITRIRRRLRV